MVVHSKIDKNESVENRDRKFGADPFYFPAYVTKHTGEVVPALFTAEQINVAIERAKKNPEDVQAKATWIDTIFGE